MTKILGIDTSNYTTSVAVVEDDVCVYDNRKILETKIGERGLRQSEALFQHINNLPDLLNSHFVKNIDAISVSVRPRRIEGSYMPVFNGGKSIAHSIGFAMGIKVYETTHQEGHIEAAIRSINFNEKEFICIHLSGGTNEVLYVKKDLDYCTEIIGETLDISAGQFIDRIGVALGYPFPSGKVIDELSLKCINTSLRIPSKLNKFAMNFSGQETLCLKYIKEGYNQEDIAYSVMLCVEKTMEKLISNLLKAYKLPIIFVGGVACSKFLKNHLNKKFNKNIRFSNEKEASDNAIGVAFIGYNKFMEDNNGSNN